MKGIFSDVYVFSYFGSTSICRCGARVKMSRCRVPPPPPPVPAVAVPVVAVPVVAKKPFRVVAPSVRVVAPSKCHSAKRPSSAMSFRTTSSKRTRYANMSIAELQELIAHIEEAFHNDLPVAKAVLAESEQIQQERDQEQCLQRQQSERPLRQVARLIISPVWLSQLNASCIAGTSDPPSGAGIIAFRLTGVNGTLDNRNLYVCIVDKAPKWKCTHCQTDMYHTWEKCCSCHVSKSASAIVVTGVVHGFPKGAQTQEDSGCLLQTALREWVQETGIPQERLDIVPGVHFDDSTLTVRLLLGLVRAPISSASTDPDVSNEKQTSWQPPESKLQCWSGYRLTAQRISRDPEQCSKCGKVMLSGVVVLACSGRCQCVFGKCCKDIDPIVTAHWMHVDRARALLSSQRKKLLDDAIAALPAP